jgi:hypothetical protein
MYQANVKNIRTFMKRRNNLFVSEAKDAYDRMQTLIAIALKKEYTVEEADVAYFDRHQIYSAFDTWCQKNDDYCDRRDEWILQYGDGSPADKHARYTDYIASSVS